MGFNPVTLGAMGGQIKGITSPLKSVKPNADKTKADYEYTDGTVIHDVPLAPEASEAKIEKVVDGKLDSVKAELVKKLDEMKISRSGLPKIFIDGDITNMTKEISANVSIEYRDGLNDFEDSKCTLKWQGNSSLSYPKKNFTLKMSSKRDLGFGSTKKVVLKANYIDHSHARNIVSARLWSQVVASRNGYADMPELLRNSPNNGAVDGFPIKLYMNGEYQGLYTWNIAKDDFMFNMDKTLDEHCVLCGENYDSACFRKEAKIDETDWSDEIHDVVPESIKSRWNEIIRFVMNSDDSTFKNNLGEYFDIESLIDYYIFAYVSCGLDSLGKNQLYATYDGQKWYATMYDMDSTWGLYWNGTKFVSAEYKCQEEYEVGVHNTSNLLYDRLCALFLNDILERYEQLRGSVLSVSNIIYQFEKFTDCISNDLYAEDVTIYTGIPSKTTNNITQIRKYAKSRLTYVDNNISKSDIPKTGLIYKLDSPLVCDGITDNHINTGIKLFDANEGLDEFTIALDCNWDTSAPKLPSTAFHCMISENSPWAGISADLQKYSNQAELNCNGTNSDENLRMYFGGASEFGRMSVIISYSRKDNRVRAMNPMLDEYKEKSVGMPVHSKNLIIGSKEKDGGSVYFDYWKGSINTFEVYDRAFSEAELRSYTFDS